MLHFNYATLALNFVVIIVYTMLIDVNYLFIFAQFDQTIPSSFVINIQLLLTHRSGCMRHMGHNLTAPDINNGHTAPLDRVTVIFFAHFQLNTPLKYPTATDMAMKRYRANDTSLRSWRRTRQG